MNSLRQFDRKNALALILVLVGADLISLPAQGRSPIPEKYHNISAEKKSDLISKSSNRFQAPPPP